MILKLIAIALIALTQVLDWHSTLAFLRSGHGREGNQMLAGLFRKYGANRVMIIKGLSHIVLVPALWFMPVIGGVALAGAMCAVYVPMIVKNYRIAAGK